MQALAVTGSACIQVDLGTAWLAGYAVSYPIACCVSAWLLVQNFAAKLQVFTFTPHHAELATPQTVAKLYT